MLHQRYSIQVVTALGTADLQQSNYDKNLISGVVVTLFEQITFYTFI